MPTWNIVRMIEETGLDDQQRPVPVVRVEFRVGDDGPFIERVPKGVFSATAVRARLGAFAQQLAELRGT